MNGNEVLARIENFEATWRECEVDRRIRAVSAIMALPPRQRDWLLRHHEMEPVADEDEIDRRRAMDMLLHTCGVLEVGFQAGAIADRDGLVSQRLAPILEDPAVRAYYGRDGYGLTLPPALLARVQRGYTRPAGRFEPAWYASLLSLNARFLDPQLDTFLSLVDDFIVDGFDFSVVRRLSKDRDAIVQAVLTPADERTTPQNAVVGLERFLFFCGDLIRQLERASASDLADAAFNLYRYWFEPDADCRHNIATVVTTALRTLAGASAEEQLPQEHDLAALFARAARPMERTGTMGLKLSRRGADLIKSFEGCHTAKGGAFRAYRCPAGVLTIGWGHTNQAGRQFTADAVWSQAECDAVFDEDMAAYGGPVNQMVKVPLAQHQFDALVSFGYNCGLGNLRSSTLLRKVNAGDFAGAALEFHKWVRCNGQVMSGLVRRRAAEAMLFQDIADRDYDGKPDMPQMAAIR